MQESYYIDLKDLKPVVKYEDSENLDYAEHLSLATAVNRLRKQINLTSLSGKPQVDATSIWEDWFDSVNADVFISHSSANKAEAIQLANWLYNNFEVKSFVDSQFWLKITDLQPEFDKPFLNHEIVYDEYQRKRSRYFYDYNERNKSTAHVHALLSYALTKMIEKTPYFIFIKSADSVSLKDSVENTTSPWIFHELAVVDLIQDIREGILGTESHFAEATEVNYPLLGKHLKHLDLTSSTLKTWKGKN